MSTFRFFILFPFTVVLASALIGCGKRENRPNDIMNVPEMKKAIRAERADDSATAIMLYQQLVNEYPLEPLPHLQLANLLFNQGKDYLEAIYHYKRFLALIGEDNKRYGAVNGRIRDSEQKLAYRYAGTIAEGSANENMRLVQNLTKQNQMISSLEKEKAELGQSNQVLRTELSVAQARNLRLTLIVQKMQSTPLQGEVRSSSPGNLSPHVIQNDDGSKRVVQTYEVKKGDNLSRIAEECYGNAALWKRIKEANPDKIEKGDRVRPGDVLIIPTF